MLVSIVTRLWAGCPGFDSWQGQGFFPLCHHVQTSFGTHLDSYTVGTMDFFLWWG